VCSADPIRSNLQSPMDGRVDALLKLLLLLVASNPIAALRAGHALNRRSVLGASAVAISGAALSGAPLPASAAASKLLDKAGIAIKEPVREEVSAAPTLNLAEQKLSEVLKKSVAEKEAALGFKYDEDDIKDLEEILRSKYCGKSGTYSSMEGGSCRESVATATCFVKPGGKKSSMNSLGSEGGCEGLGETRAKR